MKAQPIQTGRFRLQPFGERFITEHYVAWLNDPEVVRYSRQRDHRHSIESCRAYWASLQDESVLMWAIVGDGTDGAHVGNVNAYFDLEHGTADIGILIGDRRVWGQGVAREVISAVVDFLFSKPAIRKISCGTLATNQGMLGVMRKLAMVDDGVRHRHSVWEGRPVDIVYKAIFREDWRASGSG